MACSEEIVQMAKENNGIVTASMVSDAGISRGNLKYLADKGKLEKGYDADIVFLDEALNWKGTMISGKLLVEDL